MSHDADCIDAALIAKAHDDIAAAVRVGNSKAVLLSTLYLVSRELDATAGRIKLHIAEAAANLDAMG